MGCFPLLRTYGLRQHVASKPVIVDDPEKRFQSLLEGKVDAAIGYATASMRSSRWGVGCPLLSRMKPFPLRVWPVELDLLTNLREGAF